jgi:hypothetical protein
MNQYVSGDFSFITDESSRKYAKDTYEAVTKAEAWDLMKGDPGEGGFILALVLRF